MESSQFHLDLHYLGSSGIVLSTEHKSSLQTSLVILRNEQKFTKVYLWGKICGIKEDYILAQGVGKDELSDCKTLYSKDCINWSLLPPVTKEIREKSSLAKGRFTGDPAHEFEHIEIKRVPGEGDEVHEEEETITIKEEDRLASVIYEIDHDVKIVPRGAFIRTPTGQISTNRMFEGLELSEARKLHNFCHFRDAENFFRPLIERADTDKAIDFLDTIADDIPRGCWSHLFDRGSEVMLLRSLYWPGYVFYTLPGTRKFGSLYCGTGEKNMDLPFMIQ